MGWVHGALLVAGRRRTFLFLMAWGAGSYGEDTSPMVRLVSGDLGCGMANVGFASALVRPMDSGVVVRLPHGRASRCAAAGLRGSLDSERRCGSRRFLARSQTLDVVVVCGMLCSGPVHLPVTTVAELLSVRVGAVAVGSRGHGVRPEDIRYDAAGVSRYEIDRTAFLQPLSMAAAVLRPRTGLEIRDSTKATAQHRNDSPLRMVELSLH